MRVHGVEVHSFHANTLIGSLPLVCSRVWGSEFSARVRSEEEGWALAACLPPSFSNAPCLHLAKLLLVVAAVAAFFRMRETVLPPSGLSCSCCKHLGIALPNRRLQSCLSRPPWKRNCENAVPRCPPPRRRPAPRRREKREGEAETQGGWLLGWSRVAAEAWVLREQLMAGTTNP